jgi:hypothetical protein
MSIRTLSAAVGLVLLTSGLVPATAPPSVDEIVEAAAASQGQLDGVEIVSLGDGGAGAYEATTEAGAIQVPKRASDGVTVSPLSGGTAVGDAFEIGLPSEIGDSGTASLTEDGAALYAGSDNASAVVQAVDGGMRMSTIIDSAQASTIYTYDLPKDVSGSLLEDGSISLERTSVVTDPESGEQVETTVWIGVISAPWAADANGQAVETRYEMTGNSIAQVVEHRSGDVAYPIVADPGFWWGWNIYLSKAVVQQLADVIAASGNGATVAGLLLARVPGVGSVAGGAIALAGALISFGAAMLRVCDLGRGVYVGHTWIVGVLPFAPTVLKNGYFCVPN